MSHNVNPIRFSTDTDDTLSEGLWAYWPLNEWGSNDVRRDIVGPRGSDGGPGRHLSASAFGAADVRDGNLSDAALYLAGSQWAALEDVTAWPLEGNQDWTIALEFYPTFAAANDSLIAKWYSGGNASFLVQTYTDSKVYFTVSGDGSATTQMNSTNTYTQAAWNRLVVCHDGVGDQIGMTLGATTETPSAHTAGTFAQAYDVRVGDRTIADMKYDGRIAHIGVWKKKLSANEIADLIAGSIPVGT